ncbi:MAG: class II SORL domain-containing protein [Syntrophorhabdaceae bacterium]|nr:class II SORL domain-containing protein [Syntrophorhabdaceae bacterium]
MKTLSELLQTNDWKKEKHVPVIECLDSVRVGEKLDINVSVGKEIPHPNTTEHHIRWVQIFFKPDGDKFSYQLANCEFTAHGESAAGADQGPLYTDYSVTVKAIIKKPGTMHVLSFCNIHGLWENSKDIKII